tara:strand:+ start:748 stop:972 length:225 start_codon:yes stop_codon:yes gene_type:complete
MNVTQEEYKMLMTCLAEYIGKRKYLGGDEEQANIAIRFLNRMQEEHQNKINERNKSEEEYKKSTLGSCKIGSCE